MMLEKWESAIDKGDCVQALFMNLSRDFDVLNCHLVLEKLKAYGFSKKALNLLTNYLKNREQKVQINNNFS